MSNTLGKKGKLIRSFALGFVPSEVGVGAICHRFVPPFRPRRRRRRRRPNFESSRRANMMNGPWKWSRWHPV